MNDQFKSTIEWDKKNKLCKVFANKDKKGQTYFMGELTKTFKILIQKNTSQYAKEGEWGVFLVPVKYEKVQEAGETFEDEPKQKPRPPISSPDAEPEGSDLPF